MTQHPAGQMKEQTPPPVSRSHWPLLPLWPPHEPALYKYPTPNPKLTSRDFAKTFSNSPKKRKKPLWNGFHFVSVRLLRRRRQPSSPPPTRPDPCRGASGLRRRNALRGGHAVRSARATARGDSAGGEGSV